MLFSGAWEFFACLRRKVRYLVCLEEAESQGGGCWSGWGQGRGCLACCRGAGSPLPGGRDVTVCMLCGPRPSRHLAWSCPLSTPHTLFPPEWPPPGCLCLLPPRPNSRSRPLDSLPWLPTMSMGRGCPWVELGVGTFPRGAGGWVVSPCTVSPLQPRPGHRGAGSCAEASGHPSLDREAIWRPRGAQPCLRKSWAKTLE